MPRAAIKLTPKVTGGVLRTEAPSCGRMRSIPLAVRQERRGVVHDRCSAPEAGTKAYEWLAEIDTRITNIRKAAKGEGQSLTRVQARALAGEWYKWFLARHSAKPQPVEHWEWLREELGDEYRATVLPHADDAHLDNPDDVWKGSAEAREDFRPIVADGAETARFLASRGVVLDREAQAAFLDYVFGDFSAALKLLIRRGRGDYSPDLRPQQFPALNTDTGITAWELFTQWRAKAGPKPSTITRWRAVFLKLKADFGERGVGSLTFPEARDWVHGLITPKRQVTTVADIWLSAARTVCGWGVTHRLLSSNPFADVPLDVPRIAAACEVVQSDGASDDFAGRSGCHRYPQAVQRGQAVRPMAVRLHGRSRR